MALDVFLGLVRRLVTFKREHPHTWMEKLEDFFLVEAKRKWARYPRCVKGLKEHLSLISRHVPQENGNGDEGTFNITIKTGIAKDLLTWLNLIFNLPQGAIYIDSTRIIYEREAMIKAHLILPIDLIQDLERIIDITELAEPLDEREFIRLVFKGIIDALNKVILTELETTWRFMQILNLFTFTFNHAAVEFIISFNDYRVQDLQERYFDCNLLSFIEDTLNLTVSDRNRRMLLAKNAAMSAFARDYYYKYQDEVIATIKHFRKLCLMTGKIYHLFDLIAFLITRYDISIYSVQDILKMYAKKNELSEKETLMASYILDAITELAIIHATFQSNYTGLQEKVGQVLMIILQYYLVDLDDHVLSEKIFMGHKVSEYLNMLSKDTTQGNHAKKSSNMHVKDRIPEFLVKQFMIFNDPGHLLLIKTIFGRTADNLVFRFFTSFLKTSHEQLMHSITKLKESSNLQREVSFQSAVNFLCDFLIFALDKTFLQPTLREASRKFDDPKSRFSEINVATRVVEIVLFRELPLQDGLWMSTLALKFKNNLTIIPNITKIIQEKISSYLLNNFVLHDRSSRKTTPLLHEWFNNDIIKPLYFFFRQIEHSLGPNSSLEDRVQEASSYLCNKNKELSRNPEKRELLEIILAKILA